MKGIGCTQCYVPVSSTILPKLYVPATPTFQNLLFWMLGQSHSVSCTSKVNFLVINIEIETWIDIIFVQLLHLQSVIYIPLRHYYDSGYRFFLGLRTSILLTQAGTRMQPCSGYINTGTSTSSIKIPAVVASLSAVTQVNKFRGTSDYSEYYFRIKPWWFGVTGMGAMFSS